MINMPHYGYNGRSRCCILNIFFALSCFNFFFSVFFYGFYFKIELISYHYYRFHFKSLIDSNHQSKTHTYHNNVLNFNVHRLSKLINSSEFRNFYNIFNFNWRIFTRINFFLCFLLCFFTK